MRIKVIALYITALFLLNLPMAYGSSAAPVFNDIKGSYAEESISRLAGQGIISGAGGEFRPGDSITRLQFAVLAARTLGIQPVYPAKTSFADVSPGTPEAGYLEALAGMGIIKGTGGFFEAESPILRQDAAVLWHHALGGGYERLSLNERYIDKDMVSPYAEAGVAFMTGRGLMGGSEGYFYPRREMTRAEAAVLAAKLLEVRKGQALTALPVVSARQAQVKEGETLALEPRTAGNFPIFTPVYGTDSPEVCPVSPEGTVSGKLKGRGTVTVNAGYNSYIVKTEVSSPKTGKSASAGVTGEVYPVPPETEFDIGYAVKQHSPDTAFQQTERKNNPGPPEGLTSQSDTWTGFLRQQGRDITVDLKTARPVSEISVEFMQNPEWGVFLPGHIKGEVSSDGVSWCHLGYAYHGVSPAEPGESKVNLTLSFAPVTARYVKISFPVDIWVFARHLSVKGGPVVTNPAVLACAGGDSGLAGNYMQVPNINDILLVYTGDKSDYQKLAPADFMPLVGYQDKTGKISGRMFDTMLFLPYYGIPATKDSWAAYIEDLLAPGQQLMALEEAVARMNELSGLQVREKVILSIPYPGVKPEGFGNAADGENAAGERFAAVQWYYNELMGRWNSAGFKNLDLAGIYWCGEAIENTHAGEKELVQNTARLVRNSSQKFFWIPYYGTKGYENWRSYGFSHVFLQPNYFAQDSPPEDRMDRAAELARRYSLGIEIELEENVLYNQTYYNLFYNQLKKGHQLGFDGPLTNAYYAGVVKKTLVKSARSNVPATRAVYDDIYRWISGTYQ